MTAREPKETRRINGFLCMVMAQPLSHIPSQCLPCGPRGIAEFRSCADTDGSQIGAGVSLGAQKKSGRAEREPCRRHPQKSPLSWCSIRCAQSSSCAFARRASCPSIQLYTRSAGEQFERWLVLVAGLSRTTRKLVWPSLRWRLVDKIIRFPRLQSAQDKKARQPRQAVLPCATSTISKIGLRTAKVKFSVAPQMGNVQSF